MLANKSCNKTQSTFRRVSDQYPTVMHSEARTYNDQLLLSGLK